MADNANTLGTAAPPANQPKAGENRHWLTIRNVRVKNQTGDDEVVEMTISGPIGSSWYDDTSTSSNEFREAFKAIPLNKKVHVRINSEGGSVQDALEIYNLIRSREGVTTHNDGYALSSASIIHAAGSPAIAPHSSITMIHEPWSMTMGDEEDHRRAAEMLNKHGETIAGIYARKTGKTVGEMRELMRAESWFTGAEACQMGLADMMAEDMECPDCGHEFCDECKTDGEGNITCSECGETDSAHEWEESDAEKQFERETGTEDRQRRFAALNLTPYRHIPSHIYNMLRPPAGQPQSTKTLSAPATSRSGKTTAKSPSNDMKTDAILALLKNRGLELAENASEEDILAALNKLGEKPATATASPETETVILNLRTQLENERKIRVTSEVKRRAENKIPNDRLNWWINLAMQNETEVYAQIDALPVNRPGGEPITSEIVEVDNRLDQIKKAHPGAKGAKARFNLLKEEYDGLIKAALIADERSGLAGRMGPAYGGARLTPVMNSNSYSSSLVTQFLLDGAVTKLQNRWAALKIFSRDYSVDRYKPRASAQLKFVTAGGTTQKNASNFESGDATVSNVQIDVDQYTTAMHVTNDELNSGLRMENLVDIKMAECADNILKVAFAPLALASFTSNTVITRASTAFTYSDMATAWGELKKSPIKYAVLDGEYLARIINQPTLLQRMPSDQGEGWSLIGWDGVYLNTNWTGTHAGANDQNIRGLFCNPQVMGAIAGLPLTPPSVPGNTLMESTITVPDVNISIAAYSWFSLSSRTFWTSYDLMFGTKLLDESAGILLTSG